MLSEDWGKDRRPELSFQIDNEYYIIKTPNGKFTKLELYRLAEKELKIRGKLIGDGWVGNDLTTPPERKIKDSGTKIEDMKRTNAAG